MSGFNINDRDEALDYSKHSAYMDSIHIAYLLLRGRVNNPTVYLYLLIAFFKGAFDGYDPSKKNVRSCLKPTNKWEKILFEYFSSDIDLIDKDIEGFYIEEFFDTLRSIDATWWSRFGRVAISVLIEKVKSWNGKSAVDGELPTTVAHLVDCLVGIKETDVVYNPFAGSASFSILCPGSAKYIGQELEMQAYILGLIRLLVFERDPSTYFQDDPIRHWGRGISGETGFDKIISFPPINLKVSRFYYPDIESPTKQISVEQFVLINGFRSLKPGGKFVGLFSPSVLFSTNNHFLDFRKMLVQERHINTIIQLPAGLLSNTSIGLCLVILNDETSPVDKVRVIDGKSFFIKTKRYNELEVEKLMSAIDSNDGRFVKFVSPKTIANNNYNLIPERYFGEIRENVSVPDGFRLTRLSEIATSYPGQKKTLSACRVIRGKDLLSNGEVPSLSFEELTPEPVKTPSVKVLDKDLLLLQRVGQLKPTLFRYTSFDISLNPNVVALSLSDEIIPEYLVNELRKDYVSEQVKQMSYGMVIPTLSVKDLLNIKVLVPRDLSLQKASLDNEERLRKDLILKSQQVEDYLQRNKDAFFEMMSIRKHRIKPYLSGLSSNIEMLLEDLNTEGVLSSEHELFDGYTVKDALLNMHNNLAEVRELLKALTSDVNTGSPEDVDLLLFLARYSYSSKMPDRSINIVWDKPSDPENFTPIVFNSDNLKEILDEIIYNAQKHFKPGSKDGMVALTPSAGIDGISLLISNNGAPLPADFDEERSFSAGYHIDDAGTGMGLFRVRQICDAFGARIEWANDPDSSMPVALRITFKKSLI